MLLQAMNNALNKASNNNECCSGDDKRTRNSYRSKAWITALADELRSEYSEPNFRVFSSDYFENRSSFKINEFLFDITVAHIGRIPSASGRKELEYVKSCKWAIESEFHRHDSRASIIDFSKLTMARADNKLLILPQQELLRSWALSELRLAIPNDGDCYFLGFVPHPDEWSKDKLTIELYTYFNGEWVNNKANRVAGGFNPPAPTTPCMRVRTGRFTKITGPKPGNEFSPTVL